MARPSHRIWSNEIPSPKPNFTGRAAELERLRDNLFSRQPPHVQVISGMGGIGKTELATQYIHHNIDTYEIIWWIRAEHQDRVRDALVKLGQRLELRQATTDSARDRTVAAVLETLQSGRWSSWLLVFDNAANPLDLQKYIPASRPDGHVIITARQPNWSGYIVADSIEVSPFTDAESVSFLRRTVPSLARGERGRRGGGRAAGQRGQATGHHARPPAHRRRACGRVPRGDRPKRRRVPGPVHRERPPVAQRAADGFRSPRPGLWHLGDVDHATDRRCRAPVQPVLVLLAGTDRHRAFPPARGGHRRAVRPGRVALLTAAVPGRRDPVASAFAGKGRRRQGPDPGTPGGPGRH